MKKINAFPGNIKWNNSLTDPRLVIHYRRNEEKYDKWYEIHIKLSPDIVRDIAKSIKKYIISWWNCTVDTLNSIKKDINI